MVQIPVSSIVLLLLSRYLNAYLALFPLCPHFDNKLCLPRRPEYPILLLCALSDGILHRCLAAPSVWFLHTLEVPLLVPQSYLHFQFLQTEIRQLRSHR